MAKTTKEDFEYFKSEVERWVKYFSLVQWNWRIGHGEREGKEVDALAWVIWSEESRIAAVHLSKKWKNDPITKEMLSQTAFHEVCEILLQELDGMARSDHREEKVTAATHKIIRQLENTIFEYDWNRPRK